MFDVIAIGSATRDNFLEVDFKTIPWPKTPSRRAYALPLGEKLEVKRVLSTVGGNAVNASVTFARQGFKAAAVAKIGCDFGGEDLKHRLKKEGVNVDLIACAPNLSTAYSALLLQKGERTILGYHGASDSFAMSDMLASPKQGEGGRLAHMKARWWYMSLAGESDKMLKPMLGFSRRKKIAVGFNPSGHHLRHRKRDVLSSLRDISFLVVNDEEAAMMTGVPWKKERQVFKKLDALMPGILAVTEGPKGATISDGRFVYKVGTFKEKKLVDRTGAGDAFGSGFVAGLMRRGITLKNIPNVKPDDIRYAARLATANATSVVERIGATEGTLTKKEFLNPRWKHLSISVRKI
ncbi:MAG: carbohydrate kinase family protein [Candidatus Liptonbacteria bacterium]|nr:carbohydrate kinase family protein [Candidatus Liptonbacteria bacterium]